MKSAVRRFKETIEIRHSVINRLRSHRYFPGTLLIVGLLVASCFHIWQRVKVMGLVTEVSGLQREQSALIDELSRVRSDVASLSMASRVEPYAVDSLGMEPVEADRMFMLVRREAATTEVDQLQQMYSAAKRLADFVPVLSQSRARAGDLKSIKFDDGAGSDSIAGGRIGP